MSQEKLATPEECRELIRLAKELHKIAPWDYLEEDDLFIVQDPESGESLFVSVMGMAGEHFAIAAYRGAEGLYGLWHMQELGPHMSPMMMLNVPQLQLSFENRKILDRHDYTLVKASGQKFRGYNSWPMLRSYRPGFLPWYVVTEEARLLRLVVEQLLQVAPRFLEDPEIFLPADDINFFARVAERTDQGYVWRDDKLPVPDPPAPKALEISLEEELVDDLETLPRSKMKVEVGFFQTPQPVDDGRERPYLPYMLMMVDAASGMVVGFEMFAPQPSLDDMLLSVPQKFAELFFKIRSLPAVIRVQDPLSHNIAALLQDNLDIEVALVEEMPALIEAQMSLFGFLDSELEEMLNDLPDDLSDDEF